MLKFMYDTDSLEYPNLRVAYYKFEGADYRDDLRLLEKLTRRTTKSKSIVSFLVITVASILLLMSVTVQPSTGLK